MSAQASAQEEPIPDPTEERIDEILAMHGGDARSAIGALLYELEATQRVVSTGYVRAAMWKAWKERKR